MDLTFITNQPNQKLSDRFNQLIKDARFFDCLVGYFYISGFNLIKDALRNAEKIRILVGLNISPEIQSALSRESIDEEELSDKQIKEKHSELIKLEFENSEENIELEKGIKEFINFIKSGKLEVKIYPERRLHAKLYIITFKEGDRDIGRVITGSSNLTYYGLVDNLEFNVELKNRSDYEFAKSKFEELWKDAIDVTEKVTDVITNHTWLKEDITPYHLYLKFLYEYFIDDLTAEKYLSEKYIPDNYIELEYQTQAVLNAKKIIEAYNGCFISDVVGLGKTYLTARLVKELGGRTMVLAPPNLLDRKNPGSWTNVFSDFYILADFFSTGKLDEAIKEVSQRKYDNIVIDESHRFRNESTISYTKVAQICVGKRVILVTATPYNNSPKDLLSQISLFQKSRKSTIPGIRDLESFFNKLQHKLDQVDRTSNYEEYLKVVKEIAKEIRDKCLKYIMIRRTRNEIQKYFSKDLDKNKLRFPEILPPTPLIYQLDAKLDKIFMDTVELISQNLTYARYMPLLYLKNRESRINQLDVQSQKNLSGFMKVLLVKRLESSFYAFKKSLERFIKSYELFIGAYEKGKVYFSKKHLQQVFDLLSQNSFEEIQQLVDEGKAEEYNSDEFEENLIGDLKKDYKLLKKIRDWWSSIDYDPKIEKLKEQLNKNSILRNNKLVIFTEAKETAEYLYEQLTKHLNKEPLLFTGDSSSKIRDLVIDNFDARAREPKDDYRILISTEVLSEGVNLHRANVVINYDIPWNPTRLMQRVGRVNRVDTKFDKIYTYNFFPSEQSEDEIELIKIARSKIEAFLNLLGGDSAILTEGEPVSSHELFDKLTSVSTLTGEDELEESELKYLRVIEDVRDNNPELFDYIKRLPKKARSSKSYKDLLYEFENYNIQKNSLLTFFRLNKLNKFYLANQYGIIEVDFLTAAKILESKANQSQGKIDLEKFYELLAKNKNQFIESLEEEHSKPRRGGRDASMEFLKFLKYLEKLPGLTEKQKEYIIILMQRINEGGIPKKLISDTLKKINKLDNEQTNPHNIFNLIKNEIPEVFLTNPFIQTFNEYMGKKEIILSLYLSEE